jgi:cytochrome c oxidase subunit 3
MSAGSHHSPFLAHHFDDHKQQFEAGKFGMWLFLAQEILFFSGLFCAYAVYRVNHPEIFMYAHQFLDKTMGAINTVVLLFSSLTMAWAVRCAQLNQRRGLIVNLVVTFVCACVFLCIKYVEYEHKWKDGLLWGKNFQPHAAHAAPAHAGAEAGAAHASTPSAHVVERPQNAHIFFGIYFAMTGLHGIHVIAGMVVIAWLIKRARRGDFTAEYFGPVEYVGLYWHVVDLIWIYLFPLLYLIA